MRKGNIFKQVRNYFSRIYFVKININNHELTSLGNTLGISKVLKSSIGKAATLPESFIDNLKKIGEKILVYFKKMNIKRRIS